MDAFDRLREVIDNIQVGKSFSKTAQDLPNLAQSSMDYEQSHERLPKKGRSIN